MISQRPGSPALDCTSPKSNGGFNFTDYMHCLCVDISTRLEQFRHIDMHRVAVSVSQTRKPGPWGIYATTTPLRFENGAKTIIRRGVKYRSQQLFGEDGTEMLYIVTFYLPRFMDTEYREKLITVFHELWHVSPEFNGDLRRHSGRCYVHTGSQKRYDARMAEFVDSYLSLAPPPYYSFLQYNFRELQELRGTIYGTRIARPKLIRVPA
jgi:hypothetical protein